MIAFLMGACIAWAASSLASVVALWRASLTAPIVDETAAAVRYVQAEDVLVTPHGVEIPVAWLAHPDDLDEVLSTLLEIDRLGTGATA